MTEEHEQKVAHLKKASHYKFDSMLNSPTEATYTFQRWAGLAPT